ncbi:acanthoscurrin-2-like [Saccostrea cucullata]|uniref:acanthoscurrin-2-like n=1 Tax=Saccostrea cuccullata TaxID=36930 RepID=UPI002ED1B9E1
MFKLLCYLALLAIAVADDYYVPSYSGLKGNNLGVSTVIYDVKGLGGTGKGNVILGNQGYGGISTWGKGYGGSWNSGLMLGGKGLMGGNYGNIGYGGVLLGGKGLLGGNYGNIRYGGPLERDYSAEITVLKD